MAERLRKYDKVIIISGNDKGKTGEILKVIPKTNRVLVAGIGVVKKHQKADQQNTEGGIISKEMTINASNVAILDPKSNKPTKVGFRIEEGKKNRYAKLSGQVIKNVFVVKK